MLCPWQSLNWHWDIKRRLHLAEAICCYAVSVYSHITQQWPIGWAGHQEHPGSHAGAGMRDKRAEAISGTWQGATTLHNPSDNVSNILILFLSAGNILIEFLFPHQWYIIIRRLGRTGVCNHTSEQCEYLAQNSCSMFHTLITNTLVKINWFIK